MVVIPSQTRFSRLSTSTKMLLILTLALLPLGVIASLASFETARANREGRMLGAHLLAGDSADRLNLYLDRAAVALRAAARRGADCRGAIDEIGDDDVRVAIYGPDGRPRCASRSFAASLPLRAPGADPIVVLDPETQAIRIILAVSDNLAVAELPRDALAQASHPNALDGSYELHLSDAAAHVLPIATMRTVSIGREIVTKLPVAGGQLHLTMMVEAAPLSANELLLMLLPLLMWIAAATVGWLIVDRLILGPLGEMQTAIDHWRTRGGRLSIPLLTTPAHEIRVLGEALSAATDTIARHEADLEDGLARQTKLTREVHHRVKNNLQVVASLLNIHARGAGTPEAVAAYGSIQRRVDALALVHRSHFAELEVNRGLALRPLIGELAGSLRGSLPAGVAAPRVSLDLALYNATQDVAVPVAFLVTELVELAMFRTPGAAVAISLRAADHLPDRARLAITSLALSSTAASVDQAFERCERVVGGLARQLRSPLERDDATGLFAVAIPILAGETAG